MDSISEEDHTFVLLVGRADFNMNRLFLGTPLSGSTTVCSLDFAGEDLFASG